MIREKTERGSLNLLQIKESNNSRGSSFLEKESFSIRKL